MAKPGGARAIMHDRKAPKNLLDDFPTHPWATRALCEYLEHPGGVWVRHKPRKWTAWEPAANRGFMKRPLQEFFAEVRASDVADYGQGDEVRNFLRDDPSDHECVDWVITNPPFNDCEAFLHRALKCARVGVALFLRANFRYTQERYATLFSHDCHSTRPSENLIFAERCPLLHARIDYKANTATDYDWWLWSAKACRLGRVPAGQRVICDWVPPLARERLLKPGDYPAGCDKLDQYGDGDYVRARAMDHAVSEQGVLDL